MDDVDSAVVIGEADKAACGGPCAAGGLAGLSEEELAVIFALAHEGYDVGARGEILDGGVEIKAIVVGLRGIHTLGDLGITDLGEGTGDGVEVGREITLFDDVPCVVRFFQGDGVLAFFDFEFIDRVDEVRREDERACFEFRSGG